MSTAPRRQGMLNPDFSLTRIYFQRFE
jgi:hypothetical protein